MAQAWDTGSTDATVLHGSNIMVVVRWSDCIKPQGSQRTRRGTKIIKDSVVSVFFVVEFVVGRVGGSGMERSEMTMWVFEG